MAFPQGGNQGWEELGDVTAEGPVSIPLPVPIVARWYDPAPLGGGGGIRPAVVRTVGASTVVVRGSVEATFTQREVYGVALLDSIEVFLAPCSLLLTVYDDDRETELWAVSTDPGHPRPYLVDPQRYAAQELDVAAGKATLGTVTVTAIDPSQIPGDQDSGWLTERLADLGLAALAGRRCRLVRFINLLEGVQVIADGPAGAPSMDPSYAAYTWEIRDTRESERKVRIFDTVVLSLVPDEIPDGFGVLEVAGAAPILAARPLRGKFTANPTFSPYLGSIATGLSGYPANGSRIILTRAAYEAVLANSPRSLGVPGFGGPNGDQPISNATLSQVLFKWRALGSSDPWKEIPGTTFQVSLSVSNSGLVSGGFVLGQFVFQDRRLNPLEPDYDPLAPALPADDEEIEFFLYGPVRTDERHFAIVEGITAGQFAKNVYDGVYSARDPQTGAVVPTGILYDAAAVLAMTDEVKIRESAPIADARAWLEDYIYAPTGWIPALDKEGVLSPVSQAAPTDPLSLLRITNDIAEASPDWDAGERVVNVLRFTYPRDFFAGPPEVGSGGGEERQNDVHTRDILMEFRDEVSIARHGEQVLNLDGRAFRAIGLGSIGFQVVGTQMQKWDEPSAGNPNFTGEAAETANQLAFDRERHLLNRYSLGAPSIQLNVRRSLTGSLRAGSWVLLDLSWLPDYVTQRRGLLAVGQIVSLEDIDCAWRSLLIEVVVPTPES